MLDVATRESVSHLLRKKYPVTQKATPLEIEFFTRGFEEKLQEMYAEFQGGECSLGYMAEQLGLTVWELDDLLDQRKLKTRNL